LETHVADVGDPDSFRFLLLDSHEATGNAVFHLFGFNFVVTAFRAFGSQEANLNVFEKISRECVHTYSFPLVDVGEKNKGDGYVDSIERR
jgi:hypothetical protein